MLRTLTIVAVIGGLGCESKVDKVDKALDKMADKIENNTVVKKVDQGLDKLDTGDAEQHLNAAREAIGNGGEAAEDCSWVARAGEGTEATRDTVKQLAKLCSFDVPLGRATRAVTAAEKAKAEQPEAPSLTECSSDEWAASQRTLDAAFGGESRWTDLKARWAKVCR